MTDYETPGCFDRIVGFLLRQSKFRPRIHRVVSGSVQFGAHFGVTHHPKKVHQLLVNIIEDLNLGGILGKQHGRGTAEGLAIRSMRGEMLHDLGRKF
jgi:hypothetical protein